MANFEFTKAGEIDFAGLSEGTRILTLKEIREDYNCRMKKILNSINNLAKINYPIVVGIN